MVGGGKVADVFAYGTTPTGASSPDWLSSLAAGTMIVTKDNSPVFGVSAPGTFATGTEPKAPVYVSEGPINLIATDIMQGKLPSAGELWASTPIARIANNWSWDVPTNLTDLSKQVSQVNYPVTKGTSGLLESAAILPLGTTPIEIAAFEGENKAIVPALKAIQDSGVLKFGEPERAYIFNLQSGKQVAEVIGDQGSVRSFTPIEDDLPYGARYGVYHTHTESPTLLDIVQREVGNWIQGKQPLSESVDEIAYYIKNTDKYTAGGGLPSPQDIISSKSVTTGFKSEYGFQSGIVEQGVISPEGINIYSLNRATRPLNEIYPSKEAMGKAFINFEGIPEEDLFNEYGLISGAATPVAGAAVIGAGAVAYSMSPQTKAAPAIVQVPGMLTTGTTPAITPSRPITMASTCHGLFFGRRWS